jgi:hypothetical protein
MARIAVETVSDSMNSREALLHPMDMLQAAQRAIDPH